MNNKLDQKIIYNSKKILKKYKICDNCLGRLFRKTDDGLSNSERGKIIRLNIDGKKVKNENCWLCEGLTTEKNHFVKLAFNALKNYDFKTFLIGTIVDEDIIKREKKLHDELSIDKYESIKNELNRYIGKKLEKKFSKEVCFEKPTMMIIIDTMFDVIRLQIKSLYIYGRYNKYKRDIPQTKWFCKICRGKGCRKCNFTGKIYDTSVEELIADVVLDFTKGEDESFHGAGREDIDVLMLGDGRPFVIEIKNPKKRDINLNKIKKEINNRYGKKIRVNSLRFSNHEEVARIKKSDFKKVYRAVINCEKPLNNEKLKKAIQSLPGSKINQFTPSRVAHRRADKVRYRYIFKCDVESVDGTRAIVTFETESGTYVKELVSGDNNRTTPSIAELIGTPCKVEELDVLQVKGE